MKGSLNGSHARRYASYSSRYRCGQYSRRSSFSRGPMWLSVVTTIRCSSKSLTPKDTGDPACEFLCRGRLCFCLHRVTQLAGELAVRAERKDTRGLARDPSARPLQQRPVRGEHVPVGDELVEPLEFQHPAGLGGAPGRPQLVLRVPDGPGPAVAVDLDDADDTVDRVAAVGDGGRHRVQVT